MAIKDITPEQIQAWKNAHGNIFKITIGTGKSFIVRSPKIKEIEGAQYLLKEGKFITYNIFLFKLCYLAGDDIPVDEAELSAAADKMLQSIEVVTSEMEKL
ncbi:hypothetical protein FHR24_001499 [Wenyingzhuangia heitensis]|uniref:Uncharacterized protein n=1 Tax=Wenyingzhuangia heitensis TaxID=1487859 RepID=A0ABX0U888_9FLAO|nr:hypothetical protein [Wenyingzhuangia heitensis]NIJ45060.1 hypothetical protein [Wenyingzhuangia heitensis]